MKLKWPNDLLLDGAKVAGILIEAESVGGLTAVVAGIGVNCAHHPENLAYPATSLSACGVAVTPDELLRVLSRTMVSRLAQWDRGSGFATIRAEWLAHAAGLGGDIHVRLADRELSGTFETLDRMGRLMLRLPAGRLEAITVGEVFAPPLLHPPLKGEGIGGLRPPSLETPTRSAGYGKAPGTLNPSTPTRHASHVDPGSGPGQALPLSGGRERER